MAPPGLSVGRWAQRTLQPHEAYTTFKGWLDRAQSALRISVATNLVMGALIPESG